jgi:hypothetical protein
MEAANQFVSRTKTVDSSLLTMKNQQRAAWAGTARFKTAPYYNGAPTVNPILYDISSCPIDHAYTNGYTSVTNLNQHESLALQKAGCAACSDADYSTAPQFLYLQNASTCNTILTSYNNNVSYPSGPRNVPGSAGLTPAYWAEVVASSSGNNNKLSNPLLYPLRYKHLASLPSIYFQSNSFIQLSLDTVYPAINTTNTTGPDDFTIEFFVNPTGSGASTQTIFYIGANAIVETYKFIGDLVSTGTAGGLNTKYTFQLKVSTLGTTTFGEFLVGRWYHVAIMRYGSTMYYYQNGTLMGKIGLGAGIPNSTTPFTTNYLSGNESFTTIGGKYDSGSTALATGFNGYLSNFRWTKGLAVYLLQLDGQNTIPQGFTVPGTPLSINSVPSVYIPLSPYVAVGLLAQSAATLLTNTTSPIATVSLQDGRAVNVAYTAVTWVNAPGITDPPDTVVCCNN